MTQPPQPPSPWLLSAFWFGSSFHWLLLLIILLPAGVQAFVGPESKGTYLGLLTGIGAVFALVLPPWIGAQSDRRGCGCPTSVAAWGSTCWAWGSWR
ncbi:hypothetical protein ACFP81_01465 [Deinococcus lacus]|uniref:Uncharacterized protein n=1 Tax=Deinococcus lacus TaxID=392561 RepID=A0ABW1YBJ4_9DEIO